MVARIKKNDVVMVIAGSFKKEKGKVLAISHEDGRVIVEGVNKRKRHMKATQRTAAGIVEREYPIAISNVMLFDEKTGKPTRVRIQDDGKTKKRISVKSGNAI